MSDKEKLKKIEEDAKATRYVSCSIAPLTYPLAAWNCIIDERLGGEVKPPSLPYTPSTSIVSTRPLQRTFADAVRGGHCQQGHPDPAATADDFDYVFHPFTPPASATFVASGAGESGGRPVRGAPPPAATSREQRIREWAAKLGDALRSTTQKGTPSTKASKAPARGRSGSPAVTNTSRLGGGSSSTTSAGGTSTPSPITADSEEEFPTSASFDLEDAQASQGGGSGDSVPTPEGWPRRTGFCCLQ